MASVTPGVAVLPAITGGPQRIRLLLAAGVIDSSGLAFGWTVILLLVTDRYGMQTAALQTTAMLVGVALSAPFGTWLSARVSPRRSLKILAVVEGLCRLSLLLSALHHTNAAYLFITVTVMNTVAWSAFALMRSEAASIHHTSAGRFLTLYAIAIAASEALAAAAAAFTVSAKPTTVELTLIGTVYVASLLPQWLAALGAAPDPVRKSDVRLPRKTILYICATGGCTFLLASGPALLSTVLAYEFYGTTGVTVSAISFAVGTFGAARLQTLMSRSARILPTSMAAGTLFVGGWVVADQGLAGLALAQYCAGLAQCALEGDLDERVVRRAASNQITGLALGSASRALGGAAAVAVLSVMLTRWQMPISAGLAAGSQLTVLGCSSVLWLMRQRLARTRDLVDQSSA